MNKNGLKAQLVGAIAMTVVSAVALGTSTYAWFSANNKVQAQGMQVTAATEGGIEIAYGSSTGTSGTFATTATAGMTSSPELLPTSTVGTASDGVITSGWYHASASLSTASDARANSYETLTLSAGDAAKYIAGSNTTTQDTTQYYDAEGNQYYLVKNFVIRSTSPTALAAGLTVDSVSVSGSSYTLSDALRVAVVVGDKTLIYAPVSDAGITDSDAGTDGKQYLVYSGYTGSEDAGYTATAAGTVSITDKDTPTLIGASATEEIPSKGASVNGGVDVSVYIYFEGEDAYLYTNNFNQDTLVVQVSFSASV